MLKSILFTVFSSLVLLNACTVSNTANKPTQVNTNIIKPVTYTSDGNIEFSELKGFKLKKNIVSSGVHLDDSSVEGFKVFKTKEDFDSYVEFDETYTSQGFKADNIDFSKNWVLVTSKMTGAYTYEGKITDLKMLNGELLADYTYNVTYSADPMGNDYIREKNSFTKIAPVEYKELKINIGKDSKKTQL